MTSQNSKQTQIKTPIHLLNEMQELMKLRGENPFKIRAFEKAAHSLEGKEDLVERAKNGTLVEIPGIGKGIAQVLTEYLLEGRTDALDELAQALPPGLQELSQIPGVGPKKAIKLIDELGIQSVGELEYACKENRLLNLKGFGVKLQQKILEGIAFQNSTRGFQRLSEAFEMAEEFAKYFTKTFPQIRFSETGALRRRLEVMSELEFLVEVEHKDQKIIQKEIQNGLESFLKNHSKVLPFRFHYTTPEQYGYELAKTTATAEHWKALGNPKSFEALTEEDFFSKQELPWLPPETRETGEEIELARQGKLKNLLPWDGIRGVFHNHTNQSDGNATLEEMVSAAAALGYEYIGISDHSQSAFYAQGLKVDRLLEQEKEIQKLQKKFPQIRIFWGIESDILADGSLDYEDSVLKKFDFVVASIHSRFQMDRQAMTDRILKAVRNPCTRFLGHPTGRLLLGRKGYEVDMESVIAEAARCGVAVEMNANPARLDLDWRWGSEMRKHGTMTSINPDAHAVEGLKDTFYGIAMARKALLSVEQVVNSKSVGEVEQWLKRA